MVESVPAFLRIGFLGLFGSLIGSFLNVCIHRLPRGESIVTPRSACPHCGEPIPAYRNIPVLSWLLLGGRGACCGRAISARYPLVEILGAGAAVAAFVQHGATVEGAATFIFLAALIVLFFTDLDLRLLPDVVTLPMTAVGLILSFSRPAVSPLSAFAAAGAGYALFFLVAVAWRAFRGIDAVGGGDVKMMAMIGAFLAVQGALVALFVASVLGAIVGCGIAAVYASRRLGPVRRRRPELTAAGAAAALFARALRRKAVPFGCFLAIGAGVSLFFGDAMAGWYVGLLGI